MAFVKEQKDTMVKVKANTKWPMLKKKPVPKPTKNSLALFFKKIWPKFEPKQYLLMLQQKRCLGKKIMAEVKAKIKWLMLEKNKDNNRS